MGKLRLPGCLVLGMVAACSASSGPSDPVAAGSGPQMQAFHATASANGVPRDLMIAIAETEGSLAMPARRTVDADAAVPVAGPLQLRHGQFDSLARGAALMSTTELALRQDADLALEASARVLADVGARLDARRDDLATWSDALEEMSGYADLPHRKSYAHRVYALLARGGTLVGRDGEVITLAAHDLPPHLTLEITEGIRIQNAPADYAPAEWFPTPEANKWTPGRGNGPIDRIVIHDTEGGWDASVATLQNDPAKSVQYIVGTDGRVGQFVHEGDTAWHGGNWYYNQKSIGIEHVGYMNQPYSNALYGASAELVKHLSAKYGIPKDRAHIIGHDQIPNGNNIAESSAPCDQSPGACEASANYGGAGNHRDPGDFEWCLYMVERVGGTCKCNDIWPLWNCSSDKAEAFRCNNGNVEIAHCNGPGACESKAIGVDDVCHVAPTTPDAGTPPPPKDAGTTRDAATTAPEAGPPPGPTPGLGSDSGSAAAAPPPDATTTASAGCSVGRSPVETTASWFLPSALALLGLRIARRRRAR